MNKKTIAMTEVKELLVQIISVGGVSDVFDMPFSTFGEWSDSSNDAYDSL